MFCSVALGENKPRGAMAWQEKWGKLPSVKLAPETKLRCVGSKGEGKGGALIRQTEEEELEVWM